MTSGVVLSIAKCLPYELPSLLNIPHDLDPYARGLANNKHKSSNIINSDFDMYGVGSQCNTIRVPLMSYPGLCEEQKSMAGNDMRATYFITGLETSIIMGFEICNKEFTIAGTVASVREIYFKSFLCPSHAGGTAGLGLMTADLLMLLGAREVVLLGRTAHISDNSDFKNLANAECVTTILRTDVSCLQEIADAVNVVRSKSECTKGLMHAAGLQVRRFFIRYALTW